MQKIAYLNSPMINRPIAQRNRPSNRGILSTSNNNLAPWKTYGPANTHFSILEGICNRDDCQAPASTIKRRSLPIASKARSVKQPSTERHPFPTFPLLGGSKTTVTRRFPQAGHISRDSSLESGKLGPRVATSVSRSSCLR